jgi:hypothetical protein
MTGPPNSDIAQPVFVDGSGRRRRWAVLAGVALGVGLMLSLVLIIAGLFGASPIRLPGLPGSNENAQPGQVHQAPPGSSGASAKTPSPAPGQGPAGSGAPGAQPPTAPTPTVSPTSVNPAGHPRGGPSRSHPGKPK